MGGKSRPSPSDRAPRPPWAAAKTVGRPSGAMEPLGICMYSPSTRGGHARYAHELMAALAREAGNRGLRIALAANHDLAPQYRDPSYSINGVPRPLLPEWVLQPFLRRGIPQLLLATRRDMAFYRWVRGRGEFGIIHFQKYSPLLASAHFRRLRARGKRLVFTVHTIRRHQYPNLVPRALIDEGYRAAWRQCHALVVHTEALGRELSSFLIHVIPHGAWNHPGAPLELPPPGERMRRRRLLFFGTLRPEKGLDVLLRAMKVLPDFTLTIAGRSTSPAYRARVLGLVGQLPLGQVEFIDRFIEEAEIPGLFLGSSALILPYLASSAQSGVLHFAMTYGLPVVASGVGGLGETVEEWGLGRTVPPSDDAACAAAVRGLHAADAYQQACDALAQARRRLSWTRAAQQLVDVYQSTAAMDEGAQGL